MDANGTAVAYRSPSPWYAPTGSWTYQEGSYTVPAGVAFVALYAEIYYATTTTVARFDDAFLGGVTRYYISDHLGSATVITKADGASLGEIMYFPYGGARWSNLSAADAKHYKFTGQERDGESSLDHFWFRQYSSSPGRWMSPDPAGLAAVDPANPQRTAMRSSRTSSHRVVGK